MRISYIPILIVPLLMSGCATYGLDNTPRLSYRIVVDPSRTDMQAFSRDNVQCQQLAQQYSDTGNDALNGAVIGALGGAVVNKLFGGGWANESIKLGALSGAASATNSSVVDKRKIVRECLEGRGYDILN